LRCDQTDKSSLFHEAATVSGASNRDKEGEQRRNLQKKVIS